MDKEIDIVNIASSVSDDASIKVEYSLPLYGEKDCIANDDELKIKTTEQGFDASLFPNPLNYPDLKDMLFIDQNSESSKDVINEGNYTQIGKAGLDATCKIANK